MKKLTVIPLIIVLAAILSSPPLAAGEYRTMKPVVVDDTLRDLPVTKETASLRGSMLVLPPGTVLDSTYYDWQANGSLNKRIWNNSDGSIHLTHMVSPDQAWLERSMVYYYADNLGNPFSSAGNVTTYRSGFGNISSYPTSAPSGAIAVISTHDFATVESFVYADAYQGLGAFSEMTTNGADQVVWPQATVNSDGSITVVGTLMNNLTVNGITHNVAWDRAPDAVSGFSQTWTWLGTDAADWSQAAMEFPSIASSSDGKVGMAIGDFAADLHFFESTDNGVTFAETLLTTASQDTMVLPSDPDSSATIFLPWINSDIVYVGTEPHIVWTSLQGARVTGEGVVVYDFGTRILHWSPSTGIDTATVSRFQAAITSETETYVNGGSNHATIDWPQIGASPDGSVLFIIYVAFDPGDVDLSNNIGFGDIWGIFSIDNGQTWSEPVNISNPGGSYPGTDDRYPSVSPVNHNAPLAPGMDAYIIYQSDDTGGSFVQAEEGANWDRFLFTGVDFDIPSGIEGDEESPGLPRSFALSQNYPNPFNPMTTVRFVVPEGERRIDLSVYDSRGRLVSTLLSGDTGPGEREVTWNGRNGSGEPAASGVYFLRLTGETASHTIKMLLLK